MITPAENDTLPDVRVEQRKYGDRWAIVKIFNDWPTTKAEQQAGVRISNPVRMYEFEFKQSRPLSRQAINRRAAALLKTTETARQNAFRELQANAERPAELIAAADEPLPKADPKNPKKLTEEVRLARLIWMLHRDLVDQDYTPNMIRQQLAWLVKSVNLDAVADYKRELNRLRRQWDREVHRSRKPQAPNKRSRKPPRGYFDRWEWSLYAHFPKLKTMLKRKMFKELRRLIGEEELKKIPTHQRAGRLKQLVDGKRAETNQTGEQHIRDLRDGIHDKKIIAERINADLAQMLGGTFLPEIEQFYARTSALGIKHSGSAHQN